LCILLAFSIGENFLLFTKHITATRLSSSPLTQLRSCCRCTCAWIHTVNQTNGTPKLLPGPAFHVGLHVSNAPSSTNVDNALSNAGYPPTAKHKFHVLRCQQLLRLCSAVSPKFLPLYPTYASRQRSLSPYISTLYSGSPYIKPL
jgi:hypothetical protein